MKQGCLENVKDVKEKLEFLLNHSAEDFCKHIGACNESLSSTEVNLDDKKVLKQLLIMLSKQDQQQQIDVNDDDDDDIDCDECLEEAANLKPELTPERIADDARVYMAECDRIPDDLPEVKNRCIEDVVEFNNRANYLMTHSVDDFCKHYGFCPSKNSRLATLLKKQFGAKLV